MDIRGQKVRLIRLAISAVIGIVLTVLAISGMNAISRAPNSDPVGSSSVGLLAIALFVMTTGATSAVLARVLRR